ncbi:MAG TPA: hypothetical protein PLR99_20680 [Polyangiaceae bacterium]|nr:hypothetical protein [Polyangiaceae bacterium]
MRSAVVYSALASLAALSALATPARAEAAAAGGALVFEGGHARLFAGTPARLDARSRALRGDAKARAVLKALAPASQATPGLSLVRTSHERFGDGDEILSYGHVYRGLPVVGYGATVRLDRRGEAVFTSVDLPGALPASTSPHLSRAQAADVVARTYRVAVRDADAYLLVANTWEGPRLAYAVLPSTPLASGARPRFLVDATDGVVLEARDTRTFVDAQVHATNPEKSKALQLLPFAMDPVEGKLQNPFLATYNCVDRKEVKDLSFSGFKLKVHVCSLEQRATPNEAGAFVYAPKDVPDPGAAEDEYSEVSMYYHATRAYDFFRKLQGVADAQVVADKPLRTISNLRLAAGVQTGDFASAGDPNKPLDPFQNAFFSPKSGGLGDIFAQIYGFSDGAMWFGQGPRRDYAYDGDVVYHEFGHAVVDHSLKLEAWTIDARGASAAPGSMNEGLADYFSSAIAGDPDVGEYASKDFSATATVIRTLDNKDTCDSAIVGEVHYDSTLFSGAMWEARSKLPEGDRAKLDAAFYKSMRTNAGRGRVSYMDLAKMFLATVGVDLPAAKPVLEAAFTARGVLPLCGRVRTFEGKPVEAPQGPSSPGAYIAPGKATVGQRDLAPGIVQLKATIPAGALRATYSFSVVDRGGGGSPFGGGGTAFTPVVLVKFDAPITWTTTGKIASDADLTLPLEAKASSTTFDLPEGAKEVYVQIANKGDQDGYYQAQTFRFELPPAPPAAAPTPTTEPTPTAATTESSGCAVRAPAGDAGSPSGHAGAALLFATALGLGLGARRRRG